MQEPNEYVLGHVREALAADERVTQLDLGVSIVGDTLYITGSVPSEQRRDAIAAVAREHAHGLRVCNETSVSDLAEPETTEELS